MNLDHVLPFLSKSTTVRSKSSLQVARGTLRAAFSLSEGLGARAAARLFTMPRRHRRPPRERSLLEQGHRFTVPVLRRSPAWGGQTISLAAWRWGEGPTALLVHGWEGRGAQLGAFVQPLVDAGMSVVAFDAPGHGDSPGHRLFLSDMADCVGQIAEHIEGQWGRVHAIVAHSFGSAATMLAHQRYGTDAPRNVFVAPAPLASRAIGGFAELLDLEEADRDAMTRRLAVESGVAFEDLSIDRMVSERDAGLLIVHDEDDREVAYDQASLLAASWPSAQLVTTHGLGHRRILRDPAVVAEAVAYATQSAPVSGSELTRMCGLDDLPDSEPAPRD
jgi:pimeloyl-ACP methyl ester carboxylesterase